MNGSLPLALCLTAALLLSGCQGSPAAQSAEDTPVEESLLRGSDGAGGGAR